MHRKLRRRRGVPRADLETRRRAPPAWPSGAWRCGRGAARRGRRPPQPRRGGLLQGKSLRDGRRRQARAAAERPPAIDAARRGLHDAHKPRLQGGVRRGHLRGGRRQRAHPMHGQAHGRRPPGEGGQCPLEPLRRQRHQGVHKEGRRHPLPAERLRVLQVRARDRELPRHAAVPRGDAGEPLRHRSSGRHQPPHQTHGVRAPHRGREGGRRRLEPRARGDGAAHRAPARRPEAVGGAPVARVAADSLQRGRRPPLAHRARGERAPGLRPRRGQAAGRAPRQPVELPGAAERGADPREHRGGECAVSAGHHGGGRPAAAHPCPRELDAGGGRGRRGGQGEQARAGRQVLLRVLAGLREE
mmetsp:Transcript_7413/g.20006  ORF Transcript_7413/g.20006 Transcript_7413/m.20006 type:complete len:358 (-) Transcript_7413:336-1409(-)